MYSICSFFYATFICNALLISLETQISGKKEKNTQQTNQPSPTTNPSTEPSFLNTGRFVGDESAIQMANEIGLYKLQYLFIPLSNSLPK